MTAFIDPSARPPDKPGLTWNWDSVQGRWTPVSPLASGQSSAAPVVVGTPPRVSGPLRPLPRAQGKLPNAWMPPSARPTT